MKLKPYKKYKDSGIQWIGEIPEEWGSFKLKHVVNEFISGGTPSSDNEKFWTQEDEKGINWVAIADMTNHEFIEETNKKITTDGLADKGLRILPKGTLIYSIFASLGKVSILKIDATTNQAILGLIPSKKIHHIFLKYYLISLEETIIALSNANTQNNLNSTIVKNIDMALPINIEEQNFVSNFIENKLSQLDQTIEADKKLIELLKEKRTALINHIVTKGLNPKVKMKDSGIEWIGEVPEGWELKKIKHVAILKSGENITSEDIGKEGEYPVYGGNGLRGYFERFTHNGNYVLIGRQGALCGNINYAKGKFWASEHAVVVNLTDRHNFVFMGELFKVMNLNQYSQSSAQPGLSVDDINQLIIPVPTPKEQLQISLYLDKTTSKIDQTIQKIEEKIELLEEYKKSLIHHVVTGKVDVRGVAA